jgi:hypothetical protein
MQYETLGIDETQPAPLFVRLAVTPDITEVTNAIETLIKSYYPGFLNFDAMRKIGFSLNPWSDKIMGFVSTVIDCERAAGQTLTRDNESAFRDKVHERHPDYRDDDVTDYFRAWNDLISAGRIPATITQPWNYTPTTISQDAGTALGQAASSASASGIGDIAPLVLGAIAVYAAVTVFLPKMLLNRK